MPCIETERLCLRPRRRRDTEVLCRYVLINKTTDRMGVEHDCPHYILLLEGYL